MPTLPTPGDLFAARPPRPLTARPVAPGRPAYPLPAQPVLGEDTPFRQRWETGIRYSGLHRNARLVALTIATLADWQTGLIPDADQPGVLRLAKSTGLIELHVRNSLVRLIDSGWIDRSPGRTTAHPSALRLLIPDTARIRE